MQYSTPSKFHPLQISPSTPVSGAYSPASAVTRYRNVTVAFKARGLVLRSWKSQPFPYWAFLFREPLPYRFDNPLSFQ
ncbi:hypothetical protein X961_5063 [Burkholderia pseudomallei MSHR5613]|nr:hypothetical protein X961_5063 [Burkholderia pseudomallei MSHR5613]KGS78888.1 hypothetical protein X942_4263 [Burkholderia pseudomallei MSHR5596]